MLNDTYITLAMVIALVGLLLAAIFMIEDRLERLHAEVLARIDELEGDALQESEAAAIRRQFNDQCG